MALDTNIILNEWWKIALITISLVTIKTLLIFVAARTLKIESRSALQMGVLLSQGSEFAFVIFAIAPIQEALGVEYSSILIIAVAASMAITPVLVALLERHAGLKLIIAVTNEDDKNRFHALGMQAVIQQSFPRGLDMAAAVLEQHGVEKKKITSWMKRQQAQELEDSLSSPLTASTSN